MYHERFCKKSLNFKTIENESDLDNITFGIASIDRLKNYDKESKEFRYKEIHNISWDLVMVDEAHKLKEKNKKKKKFKKKKNKKYKLKNKKKKNKLNKVMERKRRYKTGINYKKRIP